MTAPEDLIIVSVDDHVVEPPTMFDGRLPARYADRAPRVIERADGREMWLFEGVEIPNFGLNAVSGRPQEEFGVEPTRFDEIRRGCWDVDARVDDMNAGGILASLNFPSFPQFCGQIFAGTEDKDLALAVLRAYNDWHIEDWAGAHPGRFIPLSLTPYWDPELMAAEVHRVADLGVRAVTWSENPEKLGVPSFHNEHWDPFWRACDERSMVICLHIGSSSAVKLPSIEAPFLTMMNLQPTAVMDTAADLLWSRVIRLFPNIRFALSEGSIGWIPYLLERADYIYEHHNVWTGTDLGGRLPSEIFRDHFIACFIEDAAGLRLLDLIGPDIVCLEADFPHSDSTWPHTPERLVKTLGSLDAETIAAITHGNAMRHFGFDPFAHRTPEESTVGALRALAGHVDVGPAKPRGIFTAPATPLTLLDLLNSAQHPLLDKQAESAGVEAPEETPHA
ncbi:MAG: amidohydrolase 2 [Acidimicrobiales bacterium]|nr:amidohydrolase 2 [Acidimicrobiales bacterium]